MKELTTEDGEKFLDELNREIIRQLQEKYQKLSDVIMQFNNLEKQVSKGGNDNVVCI